jgi:hypothetical protein
VPGDCSTTDRTLPPLSGRSSRRLWTRVLPRGSGSTVATRTEPGRSTRPKAGDGARTRSLNLGKVTVRFCIQARPIHLSGCLSTPIFERGHVAFASHHRPIKRSGRPPSNPRSLGSCTPAVLRARPPSHKAPRQIAHGRCNPSTVRVRQTGAGPHHARGLDPWSARPALIS